MKRSRPDQGIKDCPPNSITSGNFPNRCKRSKVDIIDDAPCRCIICSDYGSFTGSTPKTAKLPRINKIPVAYPYPSDNIETFHRALYYKPSRGQVEWHLQMNTMRRLLYEGVHIRITLSEVCNLILPSALQQIILQYNENDYCQGTPNFNRFIQFDNLSGTAAASAVKRPSYLADWQNLFGLVLTLPSSASDISDTPLTTSDVTTSDVKAQQEHHFQCISNVHAAETGPAAFGAIAQLMRSVQGLACFKRLVRFTRLHKTTNDLRLCLRGFECALTQVIHQLCQNAPGLRQELEGRYYNYCLAMASEPWEVEAFVEKILLKTGLELPSAGIYGYHPYVLLHAIMVQEYSVLRRPQIASFVDTLALRISQFYSYENPTMTHVLAILVAFATRPRTKRPTTMILSQCSWSRLLIGQCRLSRPCPISNYYPCVEGIRSLNS